MVTPRRATLATLPLGSGVTRTFTYNSRLQPIITVKSKSSKERC
jgi:hypothetical protein